MSFLEKAAPYVTALRWQSQLARTALGLAVHLPRSASDALTVRARATPDALALAYQGERFSFGDLERRANQYARFFAARSIGRGDVVALLMENCPELLFALLGLNRLNAVASLINTNLTGAPLSHALEVCSASAVLLGREQVASVDQVRDKLSAALRSRLWVEGAKELEGGAPQCFECVSEAIARQPDTTPAPRPRSRLDDVMCYVYTSGTTGLPKAAIIKNRRFLTAATLFAGAMMGARSDDVIYVTLPLYHSNALFAGFGAGLASGAAIALRRRFSRSEFWQDVHTFDATLFVYIGELCRYLVNGPPHPLERGHRLRLGVGNGLRGDVWRAFQQRFGVAEIREFYGSTEGNAALANFEGRPGMIGKLRVSQLIVRCDQSTGEIERDARGFCQKVAVGEKGILLGRLNPVLGFDGYVDQSATQKKLVSHVLRRGDRYFNTGDIVQLHEGGWVSFADRVGDTFRWKGENVSTNEVAEVINRLPGVLESNVYGVAVAHSEGRAGMASLSVGDGFDMQELARHVVRELPSYQRPYFIRLQTALSTTATFKHQKSESRAEGYDPAVVTDPLYFLNGEHYVPIDAQLYQLLLSGELSPR